MKMTKQACHKNEITTKTPIKCILGAQETNYCSNFVIKYFCQLFVICTKWTCKVFCINTPIQRLVKILFQIDLRYYQNGPKILTHPTFSVDAVDNSACISQGDVSNFQ